MVVFIFGVVFVFDVAFIFGVALISLSSGFYMHPGLPLTPNACFLNKIVLGSYKAQVGTSPECILVICATVTLGLQALPTVNCYLFQCEAGAN